MKLACLLAAFITLVWAVAYFMWLAGYHAGYADDVRYWREHTNKHVCGSASL